MDPLFERRTLIRNVHIDSMFLTRNVHTSLLAQLRMKYEGKCTAEGYIQRQSITVVGHSLGRTNFIKGGVDYIVQFQADVCFPHKGQVFRAPVSLKSKIGIHAELTPMEIMIARDLHIGSEDFEKIQENEEIEFEVIGARFQQGDETIVVLGKLRNIVVPDTTPAPSNPDESVAPVIAAPVGQSSDSEKKTVTVDLGSTKASEQGPRRKRIAAKVAPVTNEPKPEGPTA
jgi:DNA-directed RNA polymerase subunit E'/Rpb7